MEDPKREKMVQVHHRVEIRSVREERLFHDYSVIFSVAVIVLLVDPLHDVLRAIV